LETAKLNGLDPQAGHADALHRINDHPATKLHELLPWAWEKSEAHAAASLIQFTAALAGRTPDTR
jgi:transposase